jgi:hypothetical protein
MAMGPGKYDDEATAIREKLNAEGIILIVLGGDKGEGFSAQLNLEDSIKVPRILRVIADQIQFDMIDDLIEVQREKKKEKD